MVKSFVTDIMTNYRIKAIKEFQWLQKGKQFKTLFSKLIGITQLLGRRAFLLSYLVKVNASKQTVIFMIILSDGTKGMPEKYLQS